MQSPARRRRSADPAPPRRLPPTVAGLLYALEADTAATPAGAAASQPPALASGAGFGRTPAAGLGPANGGGCDLADGKGLRPADGRVVDLGTDGLQPAGGRVLDLGTDSLQPAAGRVLDPKDTDGLHPADGGDLALTPGGRGLGNGGGFDLELVCAQPVHHRLEFAGLYGLLEGLRAARPALRTRVWLRSALATDASFALLPAAAVARLPDDGCADGDASAPGEAADGRGAATRVLLGSDPAGERRTASHPGWWHAPLPRAFQWRLPDSAAASAAVETFAAALAAESPRWLPALSATAPAAVHGTRPAAQPVRRVLVYQARSHLGDALWLTPLLRALHQRLPDAEITVLAAAGALPALATNPRIHRLLALPPGDPGQGAAAAPALNAAAPGPAAPNLPPGTMAGPSAAAGTDPADGPASARERLVQQLAASRFDAALFAFARRPQARWLAEAAAKLGIPWRINLEYFEAPTDGRPPGHGPELRQGPPLEQGQPLTQGQPLEQGQPLTQGQKPQGQPLQQGHQLRQGQPLQQGQLPQRQPLQRGQQLPQGQPLTQGQEPQEEPLQQGQKPTPLFTHEGFFFWNTLSSPRLLLHALDPLPPAATAAAGVEAAGRPAEAPPGPAPAPPPDRRVELTLAPEWRAQAAAALAEAGIGDAPRVVITPGARSSTRWPARKFAALALALAAADPALHVLVEGGPGDAAELAEVAAHLDRMQRQTARVAGAGRSPARIHVRQDSFGALAALIAGARLVVSNDSAPIHLAEAAGTATLYFAHHEKLVHSRPEGANCVALIDHARNRPARIGVAAALAAAQTLLAAAVTPAARDAPAQV